jgi:hypothetical protein
MENTQTERTNFVSEKVVEVNNGAHDYDFWYAKKITIDTRKRVHCYKAHKARKNTYVIVEDVIELQIAQTCTSNKIQRGLNMKYVLKTNVKDSKNSFFFCVKLAKRLCSKVSTCSYGENFKSSFHQRCSTSLSSRHKNLETKLANCNKFERRPNISTCWSTSI